MHHTKQPIDILVEYWSNARIMHEHVHAIRDEYGGDIKNLVGTEDWRYFKVYLTFWIASLYVLIEGYETLKFHDGILDSLKSFERDRLRLFRNAAFHFQSDYAKHLQIFDGTANFLNWAEELQEEFDDFFAAHYGEAQEHKAEENSDL